MSAINNLNNINDSSLTINKESIKDIKDIPAPKTNKTLYIIIGVVSGVVIITAIVLLTVLLTKNDKSKHKLNPDNRIANSKQSIELFIPGYGRDKRRNLQKEDDEEEEIYDAKILGDNFNELNSSNTIVIKFLRYLTTFKEMFKDCSLINEVTLKNIETGNVSETTSMFENCFFLTGVKFENMIIENIYSTSKMFKYCIYLDTIEMKNFFTYKVKDMSQMFYQCSSLANTKFIEGLSTKNAEICLKFFLVAIQYNL